jgi:biofilm protein TabA
MFCDQLGSSATALLPAELRSALALLPELALRAPGRYPIDGERLFALVQQLDTFDNQRFEVHARYLDVQYLVSGREKIGYFPRGLALPLLQDQLAGHDIAFYQAQSPASELLLEPGMFAIFAPGELHRPCGMIEQPMSIKKVVLKIQHQPEA